MIHADKIAEIFPAPYVSWPLSLRGKQIKGTIY